MPRIPRGTLQSVAPRLRCQTLEIGLDVGCRHSGRSGTDRAGDQRRTAETGQVANQQKSISAQILKTVQSMRDAKAVGISDTGPNEAQSGTEQWTTCARVDFQTRSLYYTFFVRGEKVVESRPSVLNDKCETRTFRRAALGSSSSIY